MKNNYTTIKSFLVLIALCYSAFLFAINPTDADKQRCYIENTTDRTITFIYDLGLWKTTNVNSVEVRGSFTGWDSQVDFIMQYDVENNLYYLTCPYSKIKRPGNSGQPEYKFVVNGSNWQSTSKTFIPEGYVFKNADKNMIIVYASDDFEQIKANSITANVLKKPTDFDYETKLGKEEVSNFRMVPGTRALFRSYHPFHVNRPNSAAEIDRLNYITQFADIWYNIQSDICLTDDETGKMTTYTINGVKYTESIPEYYQQIIANNSVLYVGTDKTINPDNEVPSYNEVYYNPRGSLFGHWMQEVVRFINNENQKVPFLIHCAIGTDRTGVFSAMIGAMCGASWSEIAEDYQKTNRMGIQDFRDYHLLKYTFEELLQIDDVSIIPDLQEAVSNYFVQAGYLEEDEISNMVTKLSIDVSVSNNYLKDAFLYPNPASSYVYLSEKSDIKNVTIYRNDGRELKNVSVEDSKVDLSGIKSGCYIVRGVNNNEVITSKLLVE